MDNQSNLAKILVAIYFTSISLSSFRFLNNFLMESLYLGRYLCSTPKVLQRLMRTFSTGSCTIPNKAEKRFFAKYYCDSVGMSDSIIVKIVTLCTKVGDLNRGVSFDIRFFSNQGCPWRSMMLIRSLMTYFLTAEALSFVKSAMNLIFFSSRKATLEFFIR